MNKRLLSILVVSALVNIISACNDKIINTKTNHENSPAQRNQDASFRWSGEHDFDQTGKVLIK